MDALVNYIAHRELWLGPRRYKPFNFWRTIEKEESYVNDFSDAAKKALWLAESFGFKQQSLEIESPVMKLPLCT